MRPSGSDGPAAGLSRRRALAVGAALAVTAPAGCGLLGDDPEPLPAPDPMQPVLDEALALALAYERAALADPALAARLTPLAEDHRVHAAEMGRLIGAAAPSAPAPSTSAAAVAQTPAELRELERTAQRTAAAAARTAAPDRAGLLGSIAACRATHAEALR